MTDDAGSVVAVNTDDEYGIPGSGNAGRFQYTGQAWMPELGFYHPIQEGGQRLNAASSLAIGLPPVFRYRSSARVSSPLEQTR